MEQNRKVKMGCFKWGGSVFCIVLPLVLNVCFLDGQQCQCPTTCVTCRFGDPLGTHRIRDGVRPISLSPRALWEILMTCFRDYRLLSCFSTSIPKPVPNFWAWADHSHLCLLTAPGAPHLLCPALPYLEGQPLVATGCMWLTSSFQHPARSWHQTGTEGINYKIKWPYEW